MKITYQGVDHNLYFGIAFVRELDKKYWLGDPAAPFGVGVESAWLQLSRFNFVTLNDVIAAGLVTEMTFTDKDFDQFFAEMGEPKMKKLCEELVKNLEAAPMTKSRVKVYKNNLKQVQEQTAVAETAKAPEKPTAE